MQIQQAPQHTSPQQNWLKRMGWAGLVFFTLKGIAWIIVFVLVSYFGFQF